MTDSSLPLYSKLSSKKQRAVALRLEGVKFEAISSELGLSMMTMARWFGPNGVLLPEYNEYKSFLSDERLKGALSIEEKILKDSEAAWERLKRIGLDESTPKNVAIQALDSMLDRAGLARLNKSESSNVTELRGLTKEDRQEMFAEVLKMVKPKAVGDIT